MDRLKSLPTELIAPDPSQPRKHFDETALESLAASMKSIGQVIPVIVRTVDDGFVLIDGEMRWKAAQQAGIPTLDAILRGDDQDHPQPHLQQLASDQRTRLSLVERAHAFSRALKDGTQRSVVASVAGVSETTLSDYTRLLDLPEPVQQLVDQGIPLKGALELLAASPEIAHRIATAALTHQWTAARIKLEVGKASKPDAAPRNVRAANQVQAHLRAALKLPVKVRPADRGDGATITITARRRADIDRVAQLLAPDQAQQSDQ